MLLMTFVEFHLLFEQGLFFVPDDLLGLPHPLIVLVDVDQDLVLIVLPFRLELQQQQQNQRQTDTGQESRALQQKVIAIQPKSNYHEISHQHGHMVCLH